MSSEAEICNLALSHIRAGSINSLTEASVQAQQCKLLYPILRDQTLRDMEPQFATRVDALAVRTDDLFNWAFSYQYPSDCLKIIRLMINFEEVQSGEPSIFSRFRDRNFPLPDLEMAVEYEIQNVAGDKVIAANESELRAKYITQVTDPNLFDNQFIMGFSHLLSAELAIPLVGTDLGRQLRADSYQIYQQFIDAAAASKENEQYNPVSDSEFITVR